MNAIKRAAQNYGANVKTRFNTVRGALKVSSVGCVAGVLGMAITNSISRYAHNQGSVISDINYAVYYASALSFAIFGQLFPFLLLGVTGCCTIPKFVQSKPPQPS